MTRSIDVVLNVKTGDAAIRSEARAEAVACIEALKRIRARAENPGRATGEDAIYCFMEAEKALAILADEPKEREADGPWHTNQPTNDGLYLVEISAKFSSPSPWYETAFYLKREGWTLPKYSDCEQVLAWMEIPSRAEVKRRIEEAKE